MNKGQLIDASFVEVPRPRNSREENASIKESGEAPAEWSDNKKRQKHVEARWTKKGNEMHCGYNLTYNLCRLTQLRVKVRAGTG